MTKVIRGAGAEPSFLGYAPYGPDNPFPGAICYSVNEMVVHGIPDDRALAPGDVVTVDVGVDYQGLKTDAAWTWSVGEVPAGTSDLLAATRKALDDAVAICGPGTSVEAIARRIEKTGTASGTRSGSPRTFPTGPAGRRARSWKRAPHSASNQSFRPVPTSAGPPPTGGASTPPTAVGRRISSTPWH